MSRCETKSFRTLIDVTSENTFDFSSNEYRELFENSDATAFQSPEWLSAFYEELVPERGAEKLIITGRASENGDLVFVLPLIRRKIKGIILVESSDLGVSDYSAPIVCKDQLNDPVADDLLSKAVSDAIGKYDLLRIKPIREEARQLWGLFFKTPSYALEFSAHASTIKAPYDAWRKEAFGKSHTKYLDRKSRRFNKEYDVKLTIVSDEEIQDAISYVQQYRKGRFEGDPIQQDFVLRFYTRVAKNLGSNSVARTYQLTADGERVGVVFGLMKDGRYHYLLIGCDYENYGKHSPGLLMYDLIMADWLEEAGDVFDFTIGDEPFKAKYGAQSTKMYAILQAGSFIGKVASFVIKLRAKSA